MMKGKSGKLLVGGEEESDEEINDKNLRDFVKKSVTINKR